LQHALSSEQSSDNHGVILHISECANGFKFKKLMKQMPPYMFTKRQYIHIKTEEIRFNEKYNVGSLQNIKRI